MPNAEFDRERMVASLCRAEAYPHAVDSVEHIQTHISDVFLAGEFAYKVKKPVNFGFCDFSTRDLRLANTRRELELNQRLTKDVYLSVEPVMLDPSNGDCRIGGSGQQVEVALRMRRLDSNDRLDRMLIDGRAGEAEITALAETLAKFHSDAPHAGAEFGTHSKVSEIVLGNLARVREHGERWLDAVSLANIDAFARAFLNKRKALIDDRHASHAPRVCHGDLHAANVFIESGSDKSPELQVIDCIEFSDDFMCIDPAMDIAFLSMDLKRRGMRDLSESLISTYVEATGDPGIKPLLPFYESYRAMVRCMAASISAEQSSGDEQADRIEEASVYLALACEIVSEELPVSLIVMSGVTGSGKSTIAEILSDQLGAVRLQTDVIRKELAGLGPMERSGEGVREGIYSAEMSKKTYEEMMRRALDAISRDESVVMDGTHLKHEHRSRSVDLGRTAGTFTAIVECSLEEKEALRRLEARYRSGESESEGRPEVYVAQRPEWEPVSEGEADAVIHIDTAQQPGQFAGPVFRALWDAALNRGPRRSE